MVKLVRVIYEFLKCLRVCFSLSMLLWLSVRIYFWIDWNCLLVYIILLLRIFGSFFGSLLVFFNGFSNFFFVGGVDIFRLIIGLLLEDVMVFFWVSFRIEKFWVGCRNKFVFRFVFVEYNYWFDD